MKIAVASPPYPGSLKEGLNSIEALTQDASKKSADIICFPESYIPGYPSQEHKRENSSEAQLKKALEKVCEFAAKNAIAIIIPMDWYTEGTLINLAFVISKSGQVLGYQTKNQLDPSEDSIWTPGTSRQIFEVEDVKFGVTICHEGFRYPESVRWAANRGAQIVFHPNFTGSDLHGKVLNEWGSKENPYYEKAQMMRALENTIYFASSNYAFRYPESASSIIDPDGQCICFQEYGKTGIVVAEIDTDKATGLLAKRSKYK
jgi:predicted amidohydrolase